MKVTRRGFLRSALVAVGAVVAPLGATTVMASKPKEINLVVKSDIATKHRKLKAVWSMEAQQDLRSQHNLNAEAQLTKLLTEEINREIDEEIMRDLGV